MQTVMRAAFNGLHSHACISAGGFVVSPKTLCMYGIVIIILSWVTVCRYTVREQEMMSSFAPQEFFSKATHMHTVIVSACMQHV